MDLNYLFYRQQIERSLADAASSEAARRAHEELARAYERRIGIPPERQTRREPAVNPTLALAITAREVG